MTHVNLLAPESWPIGPLPISLTILSIVKIAQILVRRRKTSVSEIWSVFFLAAAIVCAGAYAAGIRERINLSANVFATASVAFAFLVFALVYLVRLRARHSFVITPASRPRTSRSPLSRLLIVLLACLGSYLLFTAFPEMLTSNRCSSWRCSSNFFMGNAAGALQHIWIASLLWGTFVLFGAIAFLQMLGLVSDPQSTSDSEHQPRS